MFNVGDKVTIISNLRVRGENHAYENNVGYTSEMGEFENKQMTITGVYEGCNTTYYRMEEDGGDWMWTAEMFKETETETETQKEEERPMVEHTAVERIDRKDILKNMRKTLDICDIYHPTDMGLDKILDKWADAKGKTDIWEGNSVLDILSKHPDYVPEKGYIVKKNKYDRGVNFEVINEVMNDIIYILANPASNNLVDEVEIYPSYDEIVKKVNRLRYAFDVVTEDSDFSYRDMSIDQIAQERDEWRGKLKEVNDKYFIDNHKCYNLEEIKKLDRLQDLMREIKMWVTKQWSMAENQVDDDEELQKSVLTNLLIDEDVFKKIEASKLNIRGIRVGHKFNKVIVKILTETGIKDRWASYNRQSARLGEASSPTEFIKYTIISANPVDYWRMSFGKSWKSCHTIDKEGNYRPSDGGEGYEGMHASGCSSYLGDTSSVVCYTVDEKYEGSDYEMEPKLERCMFHLGEGKFIMGRIYPQGTDGAKEAYRQWRAIFQQIIAECMGLPNYWKTEKDRTPKLRQIITEGTHYPDYEYAYCDIAGWSYIKPDQNTVPSERIIKIGSTPICPCCGREHWVDDNLECDRCNDSDTHECYECGNRHHEDDMELIDGEWYCHDCLSWCEYHEEYELEELTYVENYGYVCEYALEWGDFARCEHCGSWYYDEGGISTQDGRWFCDEDCARNEGYGEAYDGEWYPEDELYHCEGCDRLVPETEWDDELEMCESCAEERLTETATQEIA